MEDGEEDDVAAGPEMPPDFDDAANDEEGRFFGGGITNDTAQALDFVDEQDQESQLVRSQIPSRVVLTDHWCRNRKRLTRLGYAS